jgi:hypothetical protein
MHREVYTMTTTHRSHLRPKPVSAVANSFSKRPLAVFAVCLALLVPGISSAKKPAPSQDVGCALLLSPDPNVYSDDYPNYVVAGEQYQVKLVRVPSYPGAFRSPSVRVDVTYHIPPDNDSTDDTTIEMPSFYVTYLKFGFDAPPAPENTVDLNGNGDIGDAVITAYVTEEVVSKNGKRTEHPTTVCATTAKIKLPKLP